MDCSERCDISLGENLNLKKMKRRLKISRDALVLVWRSACTVSITAVAATYVISIVMTLCTEPTFDMPVVNVTVTEKETAILPCSVRFLGHHQVVWTDQSSTLLTFEDRRIIDDERLSLERPFSKDWNLHIRDVEYKDQGVYNCQVNTVPVKIKTVNLIVEVPAKIIQHLSTSNLVVRENEKVTLVCNVTGVPVPEVMWYRHISDQKGVEKQSEFCKNTDQVGVSGEVLIIHNITRYCGDTYECVAFNGVPPDVNLLIHVAVEFAPEIFLPNKRIGQDVGRETILECTVTAFPHAVSMWMRNGEKISTLSQKYRLEIYEEQPNSITLSLRIFSIERHDYGVYTCVASNPLGEDTESMILYEYSAYTKTTTTTRRTTPRRTSTEMIPRQQQPQPPSVDPVSETSNALYPWKSGRGPQQQSGPEDTYYRPVTSAPRQSERGGKGEEIIQPSVGGDQNSGHTTKQHLYYIPFLAFFHTMLRLILFAS